MCYYYTHNIPVLWFKPPLDSAATTQLSFSPPSSAQLTTQCRPLITPSASLPNAISAYISVVGFCPGKGIGNRYYGELLSISTLL